MTNAQGTAFAFALGFGVLALGFGPMMCQDCKEDRLLKHGRKADARVLSIRDTGNLYNNQPEVRIRLQVLPAEAKPFEASVTTFMSPVYLPRFQPGATVPVRYDPASPRDVALVPP